MFKQRMMCRCLCLEADGSSVQHVKRIGLLLSRMAGSARWCARFVSQGGLAHTVKADGFVDAAG